MGVLTLMLFIKLSHRFPDLRADWRSCEGRKGPLKRWWTCSQGSACRLSYHQGDLMRTFEARFSEKTLETVPGLGTLGCDLMLSTWPNTKYSFSKSCPSVAQTAVDSAATHVRSGEAEVVQNRNQHAPNKAG